MKLCTGDRSVIAHTMVSCMVDLRRIALTISRGVTQLFVFAQRALGLLGAADQLLLHSDHPNPIALIVSGSLLAGAQATESVVLAAIDRLMGEHGSRPGRSGSDRE